CGTGGGVPLAGSAEAVPHRADRGDPRRPLLAELGPDPADVDVDGPRPAVVVVSPHLRQQLLTAPDPARVLDQEPEQLVLHVGEDDRLAGDGRLVGEGVQLQGLEPEDLFRVDGGRLTTQAAAQLHRAERREVEYGVGTAPTVTDHSRGPALAPAAARRRGGRREAGPQPLARACRERLSGSRRTTRLLGFIGSQDRQIGLLLVAGDVVLVVL